MPWVRVDTDFLEHPKLQEIPDKERPAAIALYLGVLSYAADLLTDGFVPDNVLTRIGAVCGLKRPRKVAQKLKEVGLFESATATGRRGFLVHDYLDFQPSKKDVMERRKADRERKRQGKQQQAFRLESERNPGGVRLDSSASVRARAQADSTEPKGSDSTEANSEEQLPKKHNLNGEVDLTAIASRLSDADARTPSVLASFKRRGLPEAAFHTALESLEERKARRDKAPLTSEVRYFVSTLKSMEQEGQYAR